MLLSLQYLLFQRIVGVEAERNFYESQLIILDTLEKVLNSVSICLHVFQSHVISDFFKFYFLKITQRRTDVALSRHSYSACGVIKGCV